MCIRDRDSVLFLKKGQAIWQENSAIHKESNGVEEVQKLIVEFDTEASREQLQSAFAALNIEKMTYNGGTYIVYFDAGVSMPQVLAAMGAADISVMYIRNISKSTRRFFVH